MVSILVGAVCGMAVVCTAVVLPGAVGVARALLIPLQCWRVLQFVSCTVPLPGVWCVGGGRVSVLFVWWGILCLPPPRRGGGWGRRGRWGGIADGGWHCEGRAAVLLASPSSVDVPSVCWRPPLCLRGGPVEWRGGVVPLSRVVLVLFAVFPVFELDPAPCIV